MRITVLHPDPTRGARLVATDVEIDAGTTLSAARPHLARVTGWAGWTSEVARPAVDDRVLGDDHRAGVVPLVAGAVLRPWPGPPAPDALARARTAPHLAVVAGPGTGGVLPIDGGRTRAWRGLEVRRSGARIAIRSRGAWRRRRPGDVVRAGATILELRAPAAHLARAVPGPRDEAGTRRTAGSPAVGAASRGRTAAALLAPVVGALVLGVALREPLVALVGLVGPVAGLATFGRGAPRRPARSDPPDDLATLAIVSAQAALADVPSRRAEPPWGPGGTLAVVGDRERALDHARALVLGAVGSHGDVTLVVHTDRPADWRWARWLAAPGPPGRAPTEAVVEVLDRLAHRAGAAWPDAALPARRLLVVAGDRAGVPAWCSAVVEVTTGRGAPDADAPALVDAAWAQGQARRVAAARHRALGDAAAAAPPLGALPGVPAPTVEAVRRSWSAAGVVHIGTRADGTAVEVDLRRDGPHALVAGTTGAGKSELLTTLVVAHALAAPPDRLSVLLVDFKGGTGLGVLAGLPHVVDHVTDLDPTLARRVLVGLGAELRRRERVLARHAARDLDELDPAHDETPARLLVVVDELRALADDVPDAMPTLARLAAQGRSLGVHLVLATQRPAGAVPADLRANLGLRICLRVADPADSLDVLDVPDAAALDPARPGTALLRAAGAAPVAVRVARAVPGGAAPVRAADPWPTTGWSPHRTGGAPAGPQAWVEAARSASHGLRRAHVPWLPPLPGAVDADEVPPGPGLPLGLADHPERQARAGVRWEPAAGHLLVLGGPGSGRTSTLLAVAAHAERAGWAVHAVGLPRAAHPRLRDLAPTAGSVLAAHDAVAVARLLELLSRGATPTVLVLDDLERVLDELSRLARGAGADRLLGLLRAGAPGLAIAATAAATPAALRHATAFRTRVVLPVADPATDLLLGVPRDLAGPRRVPGRAVHLQDGGGALCQVALPPAPRAPGPTDPPRGPVVVPLPRLALAPAGTTAGRLALGVGDDARPVTVDVDPPLVVAGPPGSGRTRTLDVLAAAAARTGILVARADGDARRTLDAAPDALLLVDDLDDLERGDTAPELLAALERRARRIVVATTAQAALAAYRGPLSALLRRRRIVVLDPADAASAELAGPRAAWFADPHDRPPGRAVLLDGRDVTPVQVYAARPAELGADLTTDRRVPSDPTSRRAPSAGTGR